MDKQTTVTVVSGVPVMTSARMALSRINCAQVKTSEAGTSMVKQPEDTGGSKLQFRRVFRNLRTLVLDLIRREKSGQGASGDPKGKGNLATVVEKERNLKRCSTRSNEESSHHSEQNDRSRVSRREGILFDTNNKTVLGTLSTIRSDYSDDDDDLDSWDPLMATMTAPLDDTAARIRPRFYISGFLAEQNKEDLESKGITHILQVGENLTRSYDGEFHYKSLPIMDTSSTNVLPALKESLMFLHECISNGGTALVHCYAGISRSATICIAYLMWSENLSLGAAYSMVERARSVARPNDGFLVQLQFFESLGSSLHNLDRHMATTAHSQRSRCRELSSDDWEVLL